MTAKKLILVTSESHPLHKVFMETLDELSKELNLEKEVKTEDYAFLADYGEKDEFDMPFLPQLLVQTDDGKIIPILTKMPFDASLKPDKKAGKEEAIKKIKNLE
ncbi:conserved hypothetical protein [Sulfolobus islandicus Y.G.57.14]|jgi:hypothetical protein|uniref:Thioredoxin domain-containing protein n=10 Tax=Saccharolobus islandicus TaxID=43080 RepID=M9U9X5_SACIS|nr:hypothetical protein [Sulfolobus islandicus]ACP35685.1 conserved hypothetical protein [Sulfolobus islandicus L.S.2.15]ACP38322.1 conserved hypothetical protein [Sulfolobus islandicus M.14.25]ACP45839.1 conserved hypothetical protein [Sulfolobus islandicus Y.G.57.14]ACP48354.1 conserved hypothetical protein [Sulfolobus islandicus Y.N.15.51]ACP55567.1 conserved hypothetical protein [Sulfolobus islandicus M.16.27]